MAMYMDDHGILDTAYLLHACPGDPSWDAPDAEYSIDVLLGFGKRTKRCSLTYPSRPLRDAAFGRLGALIREEQGEEGARAQRPAGTT